MSQIPVLDHGYVRLVNNMGSDLDVAAADKPTAAIVVGAIASAAQSLYSSSSCFDIAH